MAFNYFFDNQAEQFSFITIPKKLIVEEEYTTISVMAKIIYGMLLDRMSKATKHQWYDDQKRVYVEYKLDDLQSDMNLSRHKAIECLTELEEAGLIKKRRRGRGKPSQIYLRNCLNDTL